MEVSGAVVVGRQQRRFIVWHSVPKGLDTPPAVRGWLTEALVDTERLVREYLPTMSGPTQPRSWPTTLPN
jgi:hypothetical protein